MNIAVVNSSGPVYNLGAEKIAQYHRRIGDTVVKAHGLDMFCLQTDKVYFSAIFTKDGPKLVRDANLAQSLGIEVEIGGPIMTLLKDWVTSQCGIVPHIGLDDRFEMEPGVYDWTFTSRGCPRDCPFCIVTKLEGKEVKENPNFLPAPNIGDNNILMTSKEHQRLVVRREEALFHKIDVNSGFDCRVMAKKPELYFDIWGGIINMWRLAFDIASEENPLRKCLEFLASKGLDRHRVQVYVLCNFPGTSPKEVRRRADIVIDLGMMPYLMRYNPIDRVVNHYLAPEWTGQELEKMMKYYNQPSVWMTCRWKDFSG